MTLVCSSAQSHTTIIKGLNLVTRGTWRDACIGNALERDLPGDSFSNDAKWRYHVLLPNINFPAGGHYPSLGSITPEAQHFAHSRNSEVGIKADASSFGCHPQNIPEGLLYCLSVNDSTSVVWV